MTVWSQFCDLICVVYGLLRRPLCDLLGSVIACLRVTCLDVNVCALTC